MKLKHLVMLSLTGMFLLGGCASKSTEKQSAPAKVAPEVQRQEMKKEAPKPAEEKVADDEAVEKKDAETEDKPTADTPADTMVKDKADIKTPVKTESEPAPPKARRRMAPAKSAAPATKGKAKTPCLSDDGDCEEDNKVLRKKPAR